MVVLLLFSFFSGILTIFAPCIWPLLPIIFSSSTTGGNRKPLGITLGIMASFAFFTLTLSYIVKIIPLDPNILRIFAVVVIGFMGLTLIVPALNQIVEGFVSRISRKVPMSQCHTSGFFGGLVTGFSLGLVWSPCAGPILATIATLAATKAVDAQVVLVTLAYVTGVGIPLFLFSTLGQYIFKKSNKVNRFTGRIQQVFGIIMILTAIAILTNFDKTLQVRLLETFPAYSGFINQIESNETVQKQLNSLKGNNAPPPSNQFAAEFTGINTWLNTEKPITMAELKGKVVLIDFWTYTCINCIRTLPFITRWYDKYKDQGFIVVGVHTPEFEFEKSTQNVKNAITQYNIHYPVAQDNEYATWKAYDNHYWPAHHLIDGQGKIRETHFGEGNYKETEETIQALLKEAGQNVTDQPLSMPDETPTGRNTPETYLGLARMERSTNSITTLGKRNFTISDNPPEHYISFGGTWNIQQEYAESNKNSRLSLHFNASKVFLVITPKKKGDTIHITIDGKTLTSKQVGKDVKNGVVTLDEPRLYELINLKDQGSHILEFKFNNEGTQIFAFTFG